MSCRQEGESVVRSLWKVGLVVWFLGLMLTSRASAFVLTGQDWSYQSAPMGEDWLVCSSTMPGGPSGGGQRTKDGAVGWNDPNFNFTFGVDVCSSAGLYPLPNNVNQVDFGGGLGIGVLAQTTSWFFTSNPADTVECDMRFSNAVPWYTGTDTPPGTQFDWWSVAIHEMGHCLGLGHETRIANPPPVMFPSFAAGEVRRTLTPDDSAGRAAIYGAPSSWAPVPGGGSTPSTPAATVLDSDLALFVRGTDNHLYVNWLLTTNQWTGWTPVPGGGSTPSTPAATVLDSDLALFVQGTDNHLYANFLLTGP
jgi:Matrixin